MNTFFLPLSSAFSQLHKGVTKSKRSAGFLCLLLLLFCAAVMPGRVQAQDTEFWFVAPDLYYRSASSPLDRPVYFVITAGDLPATVTMTMPAFTGDTVRTVHVGANQSQQIIFGDDLATAVAQMDSIENTILTPGVTGVKDTRGIRFTSDNPVFIYYAVSAPNSKAMFALKGKMALGNSFYIPGQTVFSASTSYPDAYPQFHLVATEDNTSLTVMPSTDWYGGPSGTSQPANTPVYINLNKGETFAFRTFDRNQSPRFVGSTVTVTSQNTPVAVTVVDDLLLAGGSDATGDQIVPANNVGRQYVVVRGFTEPTAGDYIYIMATQPDTRVTVTPASGAPVTEYLTNAGDLYRHHLSDVNIYTAFIDADRPVYVWQQSGINAEVDAVLLPGMNSISGRSFSFHKEAAGLHHVFILARAGGEGDFLVNGNAGIITDADFQDITGVTGWKYARKDLTASIPGLDGVAGTVRITNATAPFSLGYFFTNGTRESASFGYLSTYGDFSFPEDTVYKCPGSAYPLDGGYATSYLWTLPDGNTSTEATLSATMTGLYKLTISQNVAVTDSLWVLDRLDSVKIISSPVNALDLGEGTRTYSVDLNGQSATHLSYLWSVDGIQESIDPTCTYTWGWDDEADVSL
ncbi:MAG: IgGFc-binding protein, partial [Tannerella sp.]|nr:IgGFc-binding protein [Tannerella sp.]